MGNNILNIDPSLLTKNRNFCPKLSDEFIFSLDATDSPKKSALKSQINVKKDVYQGRNEFLDGSIMIWKWFRSLSVGIIQIIRCTVPNSSHINLLANNQGQSTQNPGLNYSIFDKMCVIHVPEAGLQWSQKKYKVITMVTQLTRFESHYKFLGSYQTEKIKNYYKLERWIDIKSNLYIEVYHGWENSNHVMNIKKTIYQLTRLRLECWH